MNVNPNQSSPLAQVLADRNGANQAPTIPTPSAPAGNNIAPSLLDVNANNNVPFGPTIQAAPANLLAEPGGPGPGAIVKYADVNLSPDAEEPSGGHPLTLAGLMEAWGTADADYDLTRDGTVDVRDLLSFVAKQQSEPDQLTQSGFAKAWGSDDPTYDLTQDGTVDVRDLLAFLETLDPEARVALDPTLAAAEPNTQNDDSGAITIAGLLGAWGREESRFDVTEDGRVDVSDLLSVLASSSERPESPQSPPAPVATAERVATSGAEVLAAGQRSNQSVNGTASGPVVDQGPADDLDGVQKSWGTSDARFDYDDNGVVDVDDLLAAIAARAHDAHDAHDAPGRPTVQAPGQETERPRNAIVNQVLHRLTQAGFTSQPPVNLHELLNAAGIQGKDRDDVLQGAAERYPNGLGLNYRV